MTKFDFFISHNQANKELARFIYHNAIFNALSVWYDESLLSGGDHLRSELELGLRQSNGYILLYSLNSSRSEYVQFEMEIAKEIKQGNNDFKILVVRLDNTEVPEYWRTFIWINWDENDVPKSIIQLISDITERPTIMGLASSASLNNIPLFTNESCTMAEQSRNYIIYYLCHVRQLIQNLGTLGYEIELRDSIIKLLSLSLFETIPNLQGGLLQIRPGVYELIHPVRMRIPPRISLIGLPERYNWEKIDNHCNEISTQFRVISRETNQPIPYPVPIKIEILLDSEL